MNFFLNASEMTQNDQESVQIYAYCNPAINMDARSAGEYLRFWRQIGTGVDWRFLAVLSTELPWLLFQCVSMSDR